MNKFFNILFLTIGVLLGAGHSTYSQADKLLQNIEQDPSSQSQYSMSATIPKRVFKQKRKKFTFNFSQKPLTELINDIAGLLDVNIILPQGASAISPTLKVTMNQKKPLNLVQAWKELTAILEMMGYTFLAEGNFIEIQKIDQNINRQPMSIYIDAPIENIPDTQEVIRAVFYLQNISIKVSWPDLNAMLKDILSPTADIRADNKTNAIILTDMAINIKTAMKIVHELDRAGTRDTIEVLPLYYISARLVDDLFNKQLLAGRQPVTPGTPVQQDQISYFPKHTKVLALEPKNSLVIMGTPDAIDLVKDFIIKYLDRPPESGESILHLYDLQYLNAQEFAPILQQILNPAQVDQAAGKVLTGPKQYFKDVIVQPELTRKSKEIAPTITPGTATGAAQPITEGAQIGGNRLIIAARKKDWIRIKQLIEDLDKPQLQVALEVLIVDVTLNSNKILGNQMRNKEGFNQSISRNVNWQTANISQPILKPAVETGIADDLGFGFAERPADALAANLLQLGDPFANNQNIASTRTAGSLILALNDSQNNGIWSIWQLLNQYSAATLLAQPFIMTKNHKQATVSIAQQRFLQGSADTSNIAPKISFEWVTAALTVDILPHISSTNNVNLQVTINVNEFLSEDANNRATRLVQTNANVGSGQILALGGLTRVRENINKNKTPLLADIPIFGWWFQQKQQVKEKNNLLIFIAPTILSPHPQGGIDQYAQGKLDFAKDSLDETLNQQNLKDPVTRWFFKPDVCIGQRTINEYMAQTLSERYETIPGATVSTEGLEPFPQPMVTVASRSTSTQPQSSAQDISVSHHEADELKKLLAYEQNPLEKSETIVIASNDSLQVSNNASAS